LIISETMTNKKKVAEKKSIDIIRFERVLKKMIATKPITQKELVKKLKKSRAK